MSMISRSNSGGDRSPKKKPRKRGNTMSMSFHKRRSSGRSIFQNSLTSALVEDFESFILKNKQNSGKSDGLRQRAKALNKQINNSGQYLHLLIYGYFRENIFKKIDQHIEVICFHFIGYFTINSNILNESFKHELHSLLSKKITINYLLNTTLLYCGSKDGFKSKTFHKLCDNKPNIIILVKTSYGTIIGGYTKVGFIKSNNKNTYDNKAFMFCLKKLQSKIYNIKKNNFNNAIIYDDKYGPIFGKNDLFISDQCNFNNNSYVKPNIYDININDIIINNDEHNNDNNNNNNGKYVDNNFVVKDIEVHGINVDKSRYKSILYDNDFSIFNFDSNSFGNTVIKLKENKQNKELSKKVLNSKILSFQIKKDIKVLKTFIDKLTKENKILKEIHSESLNNVEHIKSIVARLRCNIIYIYINNII